RGTRPVGPDSVPQADGRTRPLGGRCPARPVPDAPMIASLFVRLPSAWLALPSGLVWVLAAFQGPEVSGETKGLIGVGIGVSAALLCLLQRAFPQAGVTGAL